MGALIESERDLLVAIKNERNNIAHELPYLLLEPSRDFNLAHLSSARHLINKIDKWWIINVDIPCNPNYDGREIDENEISSTKSIMLDHIFKAFANTYYSLNQNLNENRI